MQKWLSQYHKLKMELDSVIERVNQIRMARLMWESSKSTPFIQRKETLLAVEKILKLPIKSLRLVDGIHGLPTRTEVIKNS